MRASYEECARSRAENAKTFEKRFMLEADMGHFDDDVPGWSVPQHEDTRSSAAATSLRDDGESLAVIVD